MTSANAPWLDDLEDDWVPQQVHPGQTNTKTSILGGSQHDRGRDNQGTALSSPRKQLSELGNNAINSRRSSLANEDQDKNATIISMDSVVRYDTVERKPSPGKKDATMAWKKRLVDGDLTYGDQTDLFGPSGLENLFQSPTKSPGSSPRRRKALATDKNDMPSSPPPWPPKLFKKQFNDFSIMPLSEPNESILATAPLDKVEDEHNSKYGNSTPESSHTMNTNQDQTNRKSSALTVASSEAFSPVYISKHTTADGNIGYTPLDSETARFLQKSSVINVEPEDQQWQTKSISIDDIVRGYGDDSDHSQDPSLPQVELTLPADLVSGTPPVERIGEFVTTHRGGLSAYGSFKARPLSPSDPESRRTSIQTVQHIGTVNRKPEASPVTMAPQEEKIAKSVELSPSKSLGSPLKLFGGYDTFTNRKLMNRLSQLEDDKIKMSEVSVNDIVPDMRSVPIMGDEHLPITTTNILERHQDNTNDDIEADIIFPSDDVSSCAGSPSPHVMPPGVISPQKFQATASETQAAESLGVKRKYSDRSTALPEGQTKSAVRPGSPEAPEWAVISTTNSPFKSPIPKRQRTLHELDLQMDRLAIGDHKVAQDAEDSVTSIPSAVILGEDPHYNRPWSELEQEDQFDYDTVNSKSKVTRLQTIREAIEETEIDGSIKLVSQAKAVANEVAAFTLDMTKGANENGERKKSITTQDFLNEAMQIMSIIRARGKPQSGLGSVEESNENSSTTTDTPQDEFDARSSVLRLSRPPSREGVTNCWRQRTLPDLDLEASNQLRKFKEKDDMDLLDATLQSLRLRGIQQDEMTEVDETLYEEDDEDEDEVKENQDEEEEEEEEIRINGPLNTVAEDVEEYVVKSYKTNESGPLSTGNTQGTNSSRRAENVATLGPEVVAHLIPKKVAGMTYDRNLGRWIKANRGDRKIAQGIIEDIEPASTITSDDDPFEEIPDLTVDEINEMRHFEAKLQQRAQVQKEHPLRQDYKPGHIRFSSQDDSTLADDSIQANLRGNYVAFKSSTLPSQGEQVETRATSWATEYRQLEPQQYRQHDPVLSKNISRGSIGIENENLNQATLEVIDHEASEIEELPPRQPQEIHQFPTFRQGRFNATTDEGEVSIIAELPDRRVMSVSVAVSRPLPVPISTLVPSNPQDDAHNYHNYQSMILSDLPDFTLAAIGQEAGPSERLLASNVAQHGQEIQNDRYALTLQSLVKSLTDVKSGELFWEDVQELCLRKQGLQTINNLEDLCMNVQRLDVSNNTLSHLLGTPRLVRWLNASYNCLTSLTAWQGLYNLQYLDISHNQLDSLTGLSCLVHLREVKASHNKIISIRGLDQIEGLLKLDLSNNQITLLDLSSSRWSQLHTFDASSNKITKVVALDRLRSMEHLILDHNRIDRLQSDHALLKLLNISVSHNRLARIDLSFCPSLHNLNLDHNSITDLVNLSSLKNLGTMSLQHQTLSSSYQTVLFEMVFGQTIHARTVDLSYNPLSASLFFLSTTDRVSSSISIQRSVTTLKMSNCALTSLPTIFSQYFPSLTTLILNNNGIKDIRPLMNIQGLTSLSVVGNRLTRLRLCVEALSRMNELIEIDLRGNPVCTGFYQHAYNTLTALLPSSTVNQSKPNMTKIDKTNNRERNGGRKEKEWSWSDDYDESSSQTVERNDIKTLDDEEGCGREELLDGDTRLRKRVYEVLITTACSKLSKLDGGDVVRGRILLRDKVWERLKELGILKKRL